MADLNRELETSPLFDRLHDATIEDLLRELQGRCVACVFVALVLDDEDQEQKVISKFNGGRATAVGLLETCKHDLLTEE